MAQLERETGGEVEIDDKSWVEWCRFVGVKDAEAGWRVCDLARLYALEGGGCGGT